MPQAVVAPIILGGDAGAYSLARAFHEAYGVSSVVVSTNPTRNVGWSRIVRNVYEPDLLEDPEAMVAVVRRLAQEAKAPAMVVTCADWYVHALSEHRSKIEDVAIVPYTSVETLDRAVDKRAFSELCEELGVPHPRTVVRHGGDEVGDVDIAYPLVAKATDRHAWHLAQFAGKQKVHYLHDESDLAALLKDSGDAGYRGPFVIQETIPGDDAQMRIVTTFSGQDGEVRLVRSGEVLLEEHTPGTLGNPAAILTTPLPEIEGHVRRIVEHLGWTGFANFDVKVDPRSGVGYVFELNPRTGRSNYYMTATGANPARLWVEEHLGEGAAASEQGPSVLYRIIPGALLKRYVDAATRARLKGVRVVHPLKYSADVTPKRWVWIRLAELKQFSKFKAYYPERRDPSA
ncbi:carboxylate--amine ligase [Paraoerskovia sediminicola]|uniref:Carboxylate--amine ligase n=1 Tax=Paraoerskovia sediminicola TaxID=1138587 RepID=A0ABN6XEZ7_9CELL|nr:carboxylate--amine ligase [Paraoerskovia sediminicola]BDZ43399.1 carboxylate--amine ligase [Paraoerskovia sediminicola]